MKNSYIVFVLCATLAVSLAGQLEVAIEYLTNADEASLRVELLPVARMLKAGNEHSYCCSIDHKNVTQETRTRLVSYEKEITTQVVVGYKPCAGSTGQQNIQFPSLQTLLQGFNQFGTFATPSTPTTPVGCTLDPIFEPITYTKKEYQIEYYTVNIVTHDCPLQFQICCEGYTMISGQCIDSAIVGNLMELINLGLIGK